MTTLPDALLERPVPRDLRAEEALLGSLILERDTIIKIAPILTARDFYREIHGLIYQAIADLYARREPPDVSLLASELERRGQLDLIGAGTLVRLMHDVPTAVHAEYYARNVARTAFLRRLIQVGGRIAGLGYEIDRPEADVRNEAEALLFELLAGTGDRPARSLGQVLGAAWDELTGPPAPDGITGVPCGFTALDAMTGGLQRGDLVILAARPAVGKSSFALTAAYHAARDAGKTAGIFSLEMSAEALAKRLIAIDSGVPTPAVRLGALHGTDWQRISASIGSLADLPLYFDDRAALSVTDLRSRARRLQAEAGCDLLIVDYLQLMHGSGRYRKDPNRVQEVSEISRGLKELARELNVPILALSQLSRAVETRQHKVPVLSDLRESGSLEQDADLVMFIYRDELYNPATTRPGIAEIHVAKHRNGPTGVVPLRFHGPTTYFQDVEGVGA